MLDREKLETVLSRRFPGSTNEQVAAAANAIMALGDEWEEVMGAEHELGYHFSAQCSDICLLARDIQRGAQYRLLRKRGS